MAFTPGSRRLVSSSGIAGSERSDPGEVLVWELAGGQPSLELAMGRDAEFSDVAISIDGTKLFAAANLRDKQGGVTAPGQVIVWECGPAR